MPSNLINTYNESSLVHSLSQCYLDCLPEEMVIRMLSFCGYKDVIMFASTCKRSWDVLSSSAELQLYIELEANGLQIAPDCAPGGIKDLPVLTKQLQRRRDAWLDLDIGPPIVQDCGTEPMLLWELRDDVFAKAFSPLGFDSDPNSVLIVPLGSQNHNTPLTFDFTFNEFTMDLSQELVLLAGVDHELPTRAWARLCSSITAEAHPQAKYPILSVDLGFSLEASTPFNLTLEIKGSLIAVKFASVTRNVYEILVWNWKTGILLNRIGCDTAIANFIFLDSERLVVWSAHHTATGLGLTSISLFVYDLDTAGTSRPFPDNGIINISSFPKLDSSFIFRFPKFREGSEVDLRGFLLRSDYGSQGSSLSRSVHLINSRALTLGLTMTLIYGGTARPFRIFVDTSRLLEHMIDSKKDNISSLDWECWGEHATRWFQTEIPDHWICWMFGSRFVREEEYLAVIDFNTATVRRFRHRRRENYARVVQTDDGVADRARQIDEGTWLDVLNQDIDLESSGWPDGSTSAAATVNDVVVDIVTPEDATNIPYFDEPVISRLPYRIVMQMRPADTYRGWLITENYLIGMDYDFGFDTSSNMTVYTIGNLNEALENLSAVA